MEENFACRGEIPTSDEWLKYTVENWKQRDRRICYGGIRICKLFMKHRSSVLTGKEKDIIMVLVSDGTKIGGFA